MNDLVGAVLILVVGIPVALACYFGFIFVRQAWRASRRPAREFPDNPVRKVRRNGK